MILVIDNDSHIVIIFFYCAGLCICSIDVHVSLHVLLIVQSRKANVLLIDTKTDECC